MNVDAVSEYRRRYNGFLRVAADELQSLVSDHLGDLPHIDQITARAKGPERFSEKATREVKGVPKYEHPLTEIQDQLGARVVVFYRSDVTTTVDEVCRYFRPVEVTELVPESEWEFGYFGKHLVLALPHDIIPEGVSVDDMPPFFELQVKTLFQHAWSEGNHDLGYKPNAKLTSEQLRCLAYAASQAWGADRMFEELQRDLAHDT